MYRLPPPRRKFGLVSLVTGILAIFGIYGFRRQIFSRLLQLRRPRHRVTVRRGVPIPMPDGVALIADHYKPRGGRLYPTILIRTPYGRNPASGGGGYLAGFAAQRFAERGYNVVVQDVRGRFDSQTPGKPFDPFRHEAVDGRATLDWIEKQAWFNGLLGMWGASYLGYTQWIIAPGAPLYLKALFPAISGSQLPVLGMRDRAQSSDMLLRWLVDLEAVEPGHRFSVLRFLLIDRLVQRAAASLPLAHADRRLLGHSVQFYQDWWSHPDPQEEYWKSVTPYDRLERVTADAHLFGGWYDILLRETLDDYAALRRLGRRPYLTIGPWSHLDMGGLLESLRQGVAWFDAVLYGNPRGLRKLPVRVYVLGEERWREMEDWPPAGTDERYFLHGEAHLAAAMPEASAPDCYTYDPAHPTPALGGALMSPHAGRHDNRRLEARRDVLTFTGAPLENDLLMMGTATVELYAASSLAYTDFFVRLCDVHPDGRSINVTDGFLRMTPETTGYVGPGEVHCLHVDLWPAACLFKKGHRLRLQVSSGAHPRWSRNTGSGEPLATAARLHPADQSVYHDPGHPSAITLPVIS